MTAAVKSEYTWNVPFLTSTAEFYGMSSQMNSFGSLLGSVFLQYGGLFISFFMARVKAKVRWQNVYRETLGKENGCGRDVWQTGDQPTAVPYHLPPVLWCLVFQSAPIHILTSLGNRISQFTVCCFVKKPRGGSKWSLHDLRPVFFFLFVFFIVFISFTVTQHLLQL